MPYVHVDIWAGRTKEQKAAIAKGITETIVKTLECKPEVVTVVFQEVPQEDWCIAGKPCA